MQPHTHHNDPPLPKQTESRPFIPTCLCRFSGSAHWAVRSHGWQPQVRRTWGWFASDGHFRSCPASTSAIPKAPFHYALRLPPVSVDKGKADLSFQQPNGVPHPLVPVDPGHRVVCAMVGDFAETDDGISTCRRLQNDAVLRFVPDGGVVARHHDGTMVCV